MASEADCTPFDGNSSMEFFERRIKFTKVLAVRCQCGEAFVEPTHDSLLAHARNHWRVPDGQ